MPCPSYSRRDSPTSCRDFSTSAPRLHSGGRPRVPMQAEAARSAPRGRRGALRHDRRPIDARVDVEGELARVLAFVDCRSAHAAIHCHTHTAAVLIAHAPVRFRGFRPTHLPAAMLRDKQPTAFQYSDGSLPRTRRPSPSRSSRSSAGRPPCAHPSASCALRVCGQHPPEYPAYPLHVPPIYTGWCPCP